MRNALVVIISPNSTDSSKYLHSRHSHRVLIDPGF
jgi:hypothetical protein